MSKARVSLRHMTQRAPKRTNTADTHSHRNAFVSTHAHILAPTHTHTHTHRYRQTDRQTDTTHTHAYPLRHCRTLWWVRCRGADCSGKKCGHPRRLGRRQQMLVLLNVCAQQIDFLRQRSRPTLQAPELAGQLLNGAHKRWARREKGWRMQELSCRTIPLRNCEKTGRH